MPVSRSEAIIYGSLNTEPASQTKQEASMRYLHTMLRVRDLDRALDFYCNKLGLKEIRRRADDKNRYTLVFLAAPADAAAATEAVKAGHRDAGVIELHYNRDTEDYGE